MYGVVSPGVEAAVSIAGLVVHCAGSGMSIGWVGVSIVAVGVSIVVVVERLKTERVV